jgi:asparagine synthase (glutamine-hydrolysing)
MCGILGYSGMFSPAALRAGLRAIAHRGPDDSGVYVDSAFGLGLAHVRLAIQDLSPLGHQPMLGADGKVALVFNGEIYNFHELRAELEADGHDFRGHSDTEVLLNLYLSKGESMLPRLNGIFAFALWDARTESLLLARDALGVKPLYVAYTPNGVAFGSEIKGLKSLVPDAGQLDAASLHRYLSFLWCPGDGTPFKAVRKLQPGEAMVVRAGRLERRWTWYQLPAVQMEHEHMTALEAARGTVAHLRQAVQRQLVADVPVGAFLSGGLDSSAIVAFARERNPRINCFTIEAAGVKEDGAVDDLPYARRVARHLNVPLEVVRIESHSMAGDLERMVAQMDEPLADPAALNVLYISQLARAQGMKVLLSGAGGDDLFTGYRRHRAIQMDALWSWLPVPVRRGLDCAVSRLDQRNPLFRRLSKLFNGAGLNGDERIANYFAWTREAELFALYTAQFRTELGDNVAAQPMLDLLARMPTHAAPLDRMLALEQRFFLADHNLIYTDKMSMAAGVEVRVPFLDLNLVEFAHRIPLRLKQRGREGKWILKKAMEPYLPRDVISRPKAGFGAPLRQWMKRDWRELLGDLLSMQSLKRRGLFEPEAVQRLIAANDAGRVDASYTLLSLLCIEIWCRSFVDRPCQP